jgi:hypothetical protein
MPTEEKIPPVSPGATLDKVLSCLDSINKRLDSIEEEDKKREEARKDAKRRREGDDDDVKHARHDDEEEEEKKLRKDAKRRRHDDDEEEPNRDREHGEPTRTRYDSSIVADNKRREQMAHIQSRADSVSRALLCQDAPAPMQGERVSDYRRRMLRPFLSYSAPFRNVDLNAVDDGPIFDGMERVIFDDAMAAATDKVALNASAVGHLRKVVKRDDAGRNIVEYFGTPRMWMEQFCSPARRLVRINTGSRSVTPSEIIG